MNDSFLCTFSLRKISVASSKCWFSKILQFACQYRLNAGTPLRFAAAAKYDVWVGILLLLRIPGQERQVQHQRQPVSVQQEEHGEESVDAGFWDNVHVEAVAEIDRVDVVAFEIGVHDGEEDLEEEIDRIEEDREEEQPARLRSVHRLESWSMLLLFSQHESRTYHASPDILSLVSHSWRALSGLGV